MNVSRKLLAIGGTAAAVVVVFLVVAFVVMGSDEEGSEQPPEGLPVVNTAAVVTADAVVLPAQSTTLSMSGSGILTEILASENQHVEKGYVLARLEQQDQLAAVNQAKADLGVARAALAKLNATIEKEQADSDEARPVDIENARIAVRDARERLLHVSGANQQPGAIVSPHGAIKEAARAKAIADARLAVLDAEGALEDAEDFDERLQDAFDAVTTANKNLANAHRDLTAAQANSQEDIRRTSEVFNEASEDLQDAYKKWLGITLTEEEKNETLETLFDAWELDLNTVFARSNPALGGSSLADDPATRWSEQIIYGWLFLHPSAGSIMPTCENRLSTVTSARPCVQQEIENAWDAFEDARDSYDRARSDGPTAVASAENTIVKAEQELQDAEKAYERLQTDQPSIEPDRVRVDFALAEAQLADAQAVLDDLLEWPDPLQVALAEQQLARAELDLRRLEQGRDPMVEARREAELAEAGAAVQAAEAALMQAQIALEKTELRAPFAGTVVAVDADLGQEVSPETIIARLADTSRWQIETDDLDELSVVDLQEGDTVMVTFDALPDVELPGRVTRISQFGQEKQGAITYTAEIDLDQSDPRLRWNMTASIRKDTGIEVSQRLQ